MLEIHRLLYQEHTHKNHQKNIHVALPESLFPCPDNLAQSQQNQVRSPGTMPGNRKKKMFGI